MRFSNPHIRDSHRTFKHFLLWKLGYYDDPAPPLSPPSHFPYPASPQPFIKERPSAVWIGHSTYLIEVDGLSILTDPVWDTHCSPVRLKAFRRTSEPAIPFADLPPIDLVLISHNHYDHLDLKTVSAIHKFHPQVEWVIPSRLSGWFHRRGLRNVKEIGWWESSKMKNCKITAVPAQHFSGRSLWDKNRTHWNGYVLESPSKKRLYFTGDTGYNPYDFKAIGEKWPHMDLSLIPIGTYVPQRFMKPVHVGPEEAVRIHQDVKSRLSLGMHWNTFRLSDEPQDRPPYDLFLEMRKKRLPFAAFLPIEIGAYVNW